MTAIAPCRGFTVLSAAVLIAMSLAALPAEGAVKNWTGADAGGPWWDGADNWSPAGQPRAGDDVEISSNSSTSYSVWYWNTTYPSETLSWLTLDALSTGSVSFNMTYNHPLNATYAYVGNYGIATVSHSAGTLTASGLVLGYWSAAAGYYNLTGGSINTGLLHVGYYGHGEFTHTSGTINATSWLFVGFEPGGWGNYYFRGGAITANYETIGANGDASGTFDQYGGTNICTRDLTLAETGTGSVGSYAISGGTLSVLGRTYIGKAGSGTFTQSGTANVTFSGTLTVSAGGRGRYNMNGGTMTAGQIVLASSGTFSMTGGVLRATRFTQSGGNHTDGTGVDFIVDQAAGVGVYAQTGGTHTVNSGLYLGYSSTSKGTYTLSGPGLLTSGTEYIGYRGDGAFTQTGGTHTVNGNLYLSYMTGSHGSYALSGTGQLTVTRSEYIANTGTAGFTQTGGTHAVTGWLVLCSTTSSTATYSLSAGMLSAANEFQGYFGASTFIQNGGTHTLSGGLTLGYKAGASGTLQLSGTAQLTAGSETIGSSGAGVLTQTGGANTITGNLTLAANSGSAGTYQLSGPGQLSANAEFVGFNGSGTLTHSGGSNSTNLLYTSMSSGARGTYQLSGTARLTVGILYPAVYGPGTFSINSSSAMTTVTGGVLFGQSAVFTAVPGSAIHLTGTMFSGLSTSSTSLGGLANLNLICESGPALTVEMETAGKDLGAVAAGWTDNFVLGTLTLGGTAAGRIKLVNSATNQPGFAGPEALYVNNLVMNAGAAVNLNGLNLYYKNGGDPKRLYPGDATLDGIVDMKDYITWFNNFGSTGGAGWTSADFSGDGIVDMTDYITWFNHFGEGGTPVPEPATLAVLALSGLAALKRGRRATGAP
ncbi:MAG: beta strand repeat-containing protein [Phycisphaerae bacterium]